MAIKFSDFMFMNVGLLLCISVTALEADDTELKPLSTANDTQNREETWRGILNFTLHTEKVISQLLPPEENTLFAPINILGVLGALLLGAEGQSREEILDLLGVAGCGNITSDREAVLHSVLGHMLKEFAKENENNPAINVTIAKAIFAQDGYNMREDFTKMAKEIYNSELRTINFTTQDKALDAINSWISEKTHGKIKQLLSADSLTEKTVLVLASALYFNGEWDEPFNVNSTWEYFNTEKEMVLVKMMHNKGTVRLLYDRERRFQVLGLPYKGKSVTMYIILPDKGEDVQKFIGDVIQVEDLYKIPNLSAEQNQVSYFVPYMDFEAKVDLKEVFQKLGLRSIFNENEANLSRIAEDVYVTQAIHKVNLQVTEAGTTGTASTAAIIETRAPEPNTVVVNRPFFFYIYHNPTGSITFWGTVRKPIPFKTKAEFQAEMTPA